MSDVTVTNNPQENRYEATVDGALAGFEALGEEDHRDKPIED